MFAPSIGVGFPIEAESAAEWQKLALLTSPTHESVCPERRVKAGDLDRLWQHCSGCPTCRVHAASGVHRLFLVATCLLASFFSSPSSSLSSGGHNVPSLLERSAN